MKTFRTRPIETIALELESGELIEMQFPSEAIMIMDTELGGMTSIVQEAKQKPSLACAKFIYAGMKVCNKKVTYGDAKKMVAGLDLRTMTELLNAMIEEVGDIGTEKNVIAPGR